MKAFQRRSLLLACIPCVGTMVFYLLPVLQSIFYSTHTNDKPRMYVGVQLYREIVDNRFFIMGLKNMATITLIILPILIITSMAVGLFIHHNSDSNRVLRITMLLPFLMPSTSIVPFFKVFAYMDSLRLPVYVLFVWKYMGIFSYFFMAARRLLPQGQYDAAKTEGAGKFISFIYITLPQLAPAVVYSTVIGISYILRIYREMYLMYGQYPSTEVYLIQHFINNQFFKLDYGTLCASANSLSMIILVFLTIALIIWRGEKA